MKNTYLGNLPLMKFVKKISSNPMINIVKCFPNFIISKVVYTVENVKELCKISFIFKRFKIYLVSEESFTCNMIATLLLLVCKTIFASKVNE